MIAFLKENKNPLIKKAQPYKPNGTKKLLGALMNITSIATIILLISFFCYAGVDKDSIFLVSQDRASYLQLPLLFINENWNRAFLAKPSPDIQSRYPRIAKARISMDLHYSGTKDRIIATGLITDLKGFHSLNYEDRVELLHDVLNLLYGQICSLTVCDEINPHAIKKREIIIKLMLEGIDRDTTANLYKNDPFGDLIATDDVLPAVQAEYKNGEFIYHEDYFMGLRAKANREGISGKDRMIIEKE